MCHERDLGPSSASLPQSRFSHILKAMNVHFTPEQEAQLAQIANKAGTIPERLAINVVVR